MIEPAATLHAWTSPLAGAARNIFAIETPEALVVIDAPFRQSDGRAAAVWLAGLGKPLAGVLLTHAHPDHTFGLTAMLDGAAVPVVATPAVAKAMMATDAAMAKVVAGLIGEGETEPRRTQPDRLIAPDQPIYLGGITLLASDFGETESGADTVWTTPGLPGVVFSGDLVMVGTHLSLYQGQSARFLAAVRRLQADAGPGTLFATGHGGLVPPRAMDRQIAYLEAYRAAVQVLADGRPFLSDPAKAELVRRMMQVEPAHLLSFLIAGGADPVARELNP